MSNIDSDMLEFLCPKHLNRLSGEVGAKEGKDFSNEKHYQSCNF